MNTKAAAAGIMAMLLSGAPAIAQELPNQASCLAEIRYPDGRAPNATGLQRGEILEFESLQIEVLQEMTLETACRTLVPPSIRIATLESEVSRLTSEGKANADIVAGLKRDPVLQNPYFYIKAYAVLSSFATAILLPVLFLILRLLLNKRRRRSGGRGAFRSARSL